MTAAARSELRSSLEAAVFDLDGVVTRTARVHLAAWKQAFEEFLARRSRAVGAGFTPFDEAEYRAHVDGKPRLDGVRGFLAARGLSLAEGSPLDPSAADTVQAIAKRKNILFLELLGRIGVEVDHGAVELIGSLRAAGLRVGVATSSRNAGAVLAQAGLASLFDAHVDGVVAAELGLRGKPAPDAFLECVRRLGASSPARCLVVEDATAGIAAGRAAGFALVVGVDRDGDGSRLRVAGADLVVRDLGELSAERLAAFLAAARGRRSTSAAPGPDAV